MLPEGYGEREAKKIAWNAATATVRQCAQDPTKWRGLPETIQAAEYMWEHLPSHNCYWNDRFAIALICDLPPEKLELAAWCSIKNAKAGYWEWSTHFGYNLHKLLLERGVENLPEDLSKVPWDGIYWRIEERAITAICKKFNLPTDLLTGGDWRKLTDKQRARRKMLNDQSPWFGYL